MKIALFTETYYPFINGVISHVETLRNCLEKQGHTVLIVTAAPGTREQRLQNNVLYCPAHAMKKAYGYGLANPYNLKRLAIIRDFDPDVLHVHTEFGIGVFGRFCAKRLRKPMVYTLHTMYDEYVYYMFPGKTAPVAKIAMRRHINGMAKSAAQVVSPSNKVASYLSDSNASLKVSVIPNTVDLAKFYANNVNPAQVTAVKNKLGIAEDDISLCFVGRMGNEKSVDVLIEYFAKAATDSHFKLFLIGDGPEREKLEHLIKQLGIQEQVKLLGRIEHEEMPVYYQAFDLYTTASLTEMNSISFLEASASGLYTLQRLDEANRDQISPGENGDVFSNPDDFAELLHEYAAQNTVQRLKTRTRVVNYAANYGTAEFSDRILQIYSSAISKPDIGRFSETPSGSSCEIH